MLKTSLLWKILDVNGGGTDMELYFLYMHIIWKKSEDAVGVYIPGACGCASGQWTVAGTERWLLCHLNNSVKHICLFQYQFL